MRLFRKSKKEDSDQIETSEVKVKSPTEIKEEQFQNELDYLQKEIKTKTESYESISKKLSSVKEEYDSAVANLMSAKSELNDAHHPHRLRIGIPGCCPGCSGARDHRRGGRHWFPAQHPQRARRQAHGRYCGGDPVCG